MIPSLKKAKTRFLHDIYIPTTQKPQVYLDLNHGKKVLSTEAECDKYIALYGGHHFYKLYAAFSSTKFNNYNNHNVEIIDWGCGQAIATCVLIDYFIEQGIKPKVKSITLVEPSSIALWRGYNFVRQMLQPNLLNNSIIRTVNKGIDYLEFSDFTTSDSNIKIHLFSNIIDVETFDLSKLYYLMTNRFQEYNRIICTSPYQKVRNYRIDDFYSMFCRYHKVGNNVHSSDNIYEEIFKITTGKFEISKIARYERQFTVKL